MTSQSYDFLFPWHHAQLFSPLHTPSWFILVSPRYVRKMKSTSHPEYLLLIQTTEQVPISSEFSKLNHPLGSFESHHPGSIYLVDFKPSPNSADCLQYEILFSGGGFSAERNPFPHQACFGTIPHCKSPNLSFKSL